MTGGGTGIGKGIALGFAAAGCDVVVTGRRLEPLEQTRDEAAALKGGRVFCITCDQADQEAVAAAVRAAVEALGGPIDILVNNAGLNVPTRRLAELSIEDWQTVVDVNLNGPWYWCHSVLPMMRENGGGTVINVSSIAGIRSTELAGASYCASKAGLISVLHIIIS